MSSRRRIIGALVRKHDFDFDAVARNLRSQSPDSSEADPAYCRHQFALLDLEEQKAHGEFTGVEYEKEQLEELEAALVDDSAPSATSPGVDKVFQAAKLKVLCHWPLFC